MRLLTEYFQEEERKLNKSTVGVICSDCNKSAYYFRLKKVDFGSPKKCLICSDFKTSGIRLEDFILTLNGHLHELYKLDASNDTSNISLREMLKYFTYDNDDVLSKLSDLLCNSNPSFFIKDGLYKNIIDDNFIYKCSDEAKKTWDKFSLELKHERRFNHKEATSFYENLISLCKKKEEEITEYTALRKVSKGTILYRARLVKDDDHLESIVQNPLDELSAPPEKFAANSRMSPPGIAFMYTAGDHKTAVAEIHPYAGDKVAVASFTCTKDLNFFDFTLLDNVNYMKANILTDPIKNKYFQNGYFIRKLHELISKPYRSTDVSYIETQVLAEVIRHHEGGLYDGIIFRSTQRENGMNYVVFGSRIESNDKASRKDYCLELEKKDSITIYNIKCIDIGMDK